jgi:hypothetical protein
MAAAPIPSALEAIERGLADVHERLSAMTPAESLAGFDERVSELSHKMDSLTVGSPDPETLRYLEAAINELRELSEGVASAEGVASLAATCRRSAHASTTLLSGPVRPGSTRSRSASTNLPMHSIAASSRSGRCRVTWNRW